MKVRQHIYLEREVTDTLKAFAAARGWSMNRLVNEALHDWVTRRGVKEIDPLLKDRLDRLARDSHRIRRDVGVLVESLTLFVRYQLSATAPLVPNDPGRHHGPARFEEGAPQVGEQLATGKSTVGGPAEEEPS